eukprot:7015541-Alexandrium_andersonii.AAC.1
MLNGLPESSTAQERCGLWTPCSMRIRVAQDSPRGQAPLQARVAISGCVRGLERSKPCEPRPPLTGGTCLQAWRSKRVDPQR